MNRQGAIERRLSGHHHRRRWGVALAATAVASALVMAAPSATARPIPGDTLQTSPQAASSYAAAPTAPTATDEQLQEIAGDMQGKHEALTHGTEELGWPDGPDFQHHAQPPSDWAAVTPWGQVYETREGNPATNTWVHLKDIGAWYLSKKDGQWHPWIDSPEVTGSFYREDYADDDHIDDPKRIRDEAEGGSAVRPGDGRNFHFWGDPYRASMDPGDIAGIWTRFRARLVTADSAKPDDRHLAQFTACAGGDFWRSLTASWAADWSNNGGFGMGKCKLVTKDWRTFNLTTLTLEELRKNPPPVNE
ncbi:MAG: hypothetical protein ACRCY8_05055 [Dermatophilaceae bacterium]